MTGLHSTNNKGSIPGFQLPFFQNLPSKVAPTSVPNFCNHFILKAFLMSAKVTLNSQFAQGIATNLASDGAPTKQIVLPPGNGHLMAIQFQGREESLFVIPNYFTSKPKYCFLLAHVSLLPIIIYPTITYLLLFRFSSEICKLCRGKLEKAVSLVVFSSPISASETVKDPDDVEAQEVTAEYIAQVCNIPNKCCTNCFLSENLSKWTVQTLY